MRSGSVPAVLGRRLGQALLGPAIADLADGVTHLLVVPDDVLHRVPFDALQTADGRWAVERFALSQVPSASVAVHLWEKQRNADEVALLAVADPAFGQSGTAGESHDTDLLERAFQEAGGLPRLAASAREARSVARFARRAVLRLREGASESFLKRAQLDRYQVLHFATHALADERALTRTALALSPGEGEDGFVTAADLAELRLDADLVVLSGCNTAGGVVVGGEGIAGLTAPLLEAGARAVVASRWPIGDRTTARLLEEFYRLQAEGLSVGDALRSVKLRALQRGEPSAVWATFSVVGDPFVQLSLQKPRARLNWAVLVGLSLVVAYLVWMRRRRGLARTGPASRRSAATHQR